jgi:hypothetical protein
VVISPRDNGYRNGDEPDPWIGARRLRVVRAIANRDEVGTRVDALTPQQVNHYTHLGFVLLRGWFADEFTMIDREFTRLMSEHCSGNPHDGVNRTLRWQLLDSSPALAALLDSSKVTNAFGPVLGDDWQYFGSVGNLYAGDTGWHTDNYSRHGRAKMAIYLDPTGPGAGGLSVIPLSHNISVDVSELHLALGMSRKSIGLHGSEVPCLTISTEPGDALLFNHNILHSSWGGGGARRMLSINAHARYSDDEAESLRRDVLNLSRFLRPSPYGEHMLAGASPARRAHLEQALSYGDELARAVAEAAQQGAGTAKDKLPDLSENEDPEIALREFTRDNDYVFPDGWLVNR